MSTTNRSIAGSSSTLAAFVIGVPLGIGILCLVPLLAVHEPKIERYLHHPVEQVELVMFCAALGALLAKIVASVREKAALRAEIIPPWDGKPGPIHRAAVLLEEHEASLKKWSGTWLGRRYLSVLDFVKSRGSAGELDDHLRTQADNDMMSQDASYSLIRFITWAIPILGFLGTVLGITDAISNVTPESLEKEMHKVTGGLSLAFDATALGLGLTMILMFFTFLVERREQSVLEKVDIIAEAELGHRFVRSTVDHSPVMRAIEASSQTLIHMASDLVEKQAAVWAQSLDQIAKTSRDAGQSNQKVLISSLEQALDSTLSRHAQRLADMEKQMLTRQEQLIGAVGKMAEVLKVTSQQQQQGLETVSQRLAQQTTALTHLQENGSELARLQEILAQNLSTLAGAGAFEEAVQSLTAAIHLLTTRVVPAAPKKVA